MDIRMSKLRKLESRTQSEKDIAPPTPEPNVPNVPEKTPRRLLSMSRSLPHPAVCRDTIILKDPMCNSFMRKVDRAQARILTEERPEQFQAGFGENSLSDDAVCQALNSLPDLSAAINSYVHIQTIWTEPADDPLVTIGSGVLVGNDTILTAKHLFEAKGSARVADIRIFHDDSFLVGKEGIRASLQSIPREIWDMCNMNLLKTTLGSTLPDTELDFAVLRSKERICEGPFLKLSVSLPIRDDKSILCSLGYPAMPQGGFDSVFIGSFRGHVRRSFEKPDEIFKKLFYSTVFNHTSSLASFGPEVKGGFADAYYFPSEMSSMSGFSGGPVVRLDKPDELFGLTYGGFDGVPEALVLRADCPVVQKAAEHFLAESN